MVKKYTELDITQIKQNLIDFFKTKSEFQDFNFEGSSIGILMDLLALTTAYNGFYANMVGNEMFLDSATIRSNIVSRAKTIGYKPRSASSAEVILKLRFDLSAEVTQPNSITIPQYTKFQSRFDENIYTFYTVDEYVFINNGSGIYTGDVYVYEGSLLTHTFNVDNNIFPQQRFILPNNNIDHTRLKVRVQESLSTPTIVTYRQVDNITTVDRNDYVYFVQETEDGETEIYFGDGIIGQEIVNGNVIKITYLVTNGEDVNGISIFTSSGIGIYSSSQYKITTVQSAQRGAFPESNESIKKIAPLFYESQNRLVNSSDYETVLLKENPEIEYVKVWGGEENDPPRYGVVFISAKPVGGLAFNTQEKDRLISSTIEPKNPVSIEVEIVDPDYMFIVVNSLVKYSSRTNNLDDGQVKNLVLLSMLNYGSINLTGFNGEFRYSKFVKYIDDSDVSINSNITSIKLKYEIIPPINQSRRFEFSFQTEIDLGDSLNNVSGVESSLFLKNGLSSFLADDGNGCLFIYRRVLGQRVIVEKDIGTVDYSTGKIIIPALTIEGIVDGSEKIKFFVIPKTNDFVTSRNRILLLQESDITIKTQNESV